MSAIAAVLAAAGCADDEAADGAARATRAAPLRPPSISWSRSTQSFLTAMEAREDARACRTMTRRLQQGITLSLERLAEPGRYRTRAADIYSMAKVPTMELATKKSGSLGQA